MEATLPYIAMGRETIQLKGYVTMAYTDQNQIGEITEVTGSAKIIRTDGTQEPILLGTEVYQGDIIETSGDSAVNIGFIDESSFAVSDDARIAIDEFIFDPQTEGGVQDFSVVRGVFMYTSGLIGRENPDQVEIDTPVGSIGIRGTIIGGNIQPEGESSVSVIEGAIVVRNNGGEQLLTNQFDTVSLTSIDSAPSAPKQMGVSDIMSKFQAVESVSSNLFSSFEDQAQQEQQNVNNGLDSAEDNAAKAEEANESEEIQQQADPAQEEAPQELAPETETLKSEAELETMSQDDMREALQERREAMKELRQERREARKEAREEAKEKDADDQDDLFEEEPEVTIETPKEISFVSGGSIEENSNGTTNAVVVGTIAVSNIANPSYSFTNGNTTQAGFSIDPVTGEISYITNGSNLDYETSDTRILGIRITDSDSGKQYDRPLEIQINDVNEPATIRLLEEDDFDVSSNTDGVVALNDLSGFKILEIDIDDPEGDQYSAADFNVIGNFAAQPASNFFEVVEDGGDFYLALKQGYQIVENSGSFFINDGTSNVTGSSSESFGLGISLFGSTIPVNLVMGNIEDAVSGTALNITNDVTYGDDGDNVFILDNADFKFIKGGEGIDTIQLGNSTAFDMTSILSNTLHNSADLSSIEILELKDNAVDLKINIDDIMRLLNSSDNGVVEISQDESFTAGTIQFNDVGHGYDQLTNHGFNDDGQVTHNGETYHQFSHSDGVVLIDADINGAVTGGAL